MGIILVEVRRDAERRTGDPTTTTRTKQTAGNNALLKKARRVWNTPIFKHAAAIMNAEGEAAAVAYLQQFVNCPVVAHMDAIIAYLDER